MLNQLLTLILAGYVCSELPAQSHEQFQQKTDNVKVVHDLAYYSGQDADDKKHRLDLYLPTDRTRFPVLLFVHSGGYQKGDREEAKAFGSTFASQGIGVAAISYRLFPQVKHPEHIRDVARAFRWVKENIKSYGGNDEQVFVSGHSAGAHLVSLLATDKRFLQGESKSVQDIKGVVAISGGYRILPIRRDVFGDDNAMKDASPFSHISHGHPPFLIIYGGDENKERHELSKEFQNALLNAKGNAECIAIQGRDHQGLFTKISPNDPTVEAVLAFIKKQTASVPK